MLKFVMRICFLPSIRLFTKMLQIHEFVSSPFCGCCIIQDFVPIIEMSTQVMWIHQMQLTYLKRNRTTFGYGFNYLIKRQLVFIEFQKLAKCRICKSRLQNLVYFIKSITICKKHTALPLYYLYPLNKLKICFQSESHKNITKCKQSRKFFCLSYKIY